MNPKSDPEPKLEEVWLPIVPRYRNQFEVSNLGRVRNRGKLIQRKHKYDGTAFVHLRRKPYQVARLVLDYFVGKRTPYIKTFHLDDDKDNCELNNLEWRYWSNE